MIITIDGPTASGKSTIATRLAQKLGYLSINSGLLFRAIAYIVDKKNLKLTDPAVHQMLSNLVNKEESFRYAYSPQDGAQIWYQDENITPSLKTAQIDTGASLVATDPFVRDLLLTYQRTLADDTDIVAEGRDTGTVVFPDATVKLFITAQLSIRAERWQQEQERKGKRYSLPESEQLVAERDARDEQRTYAPLVIPKGATIIDTSNLSIEETIDACLAVIHSS